MNKNNNKNNKKRLPSLTFEEMQIMKSEDQMCPFGRKTLVLGVRCKNCTFNHLSDSSCYGTKEKVREHIRRLDLEY